MCALNQTLKTWLEEELFPKLKILLHKSECAVKYKISLPKNSQFMSTLFFVDLHFSELQGKDESEINMVIKRPSCKKYLHEWINFEALFHNEILFYTKYTKNYKNCPRLLYAFEKPPFDSTIVTENLNKDGYHLSSDKVNLNIKYISAALRELARFHATGYIVKQNNPIEFSEIVKDIQNHRHTTTNNMCVVISSKVPRILRYLRKEKYEQVFCDKIERFLSDSHLNVILGMSEPIEPLATLCHGDFTINNILYKEDDENIKVKLIDFSMITYCSPFVDFSVFLLLSGTRAHRKEKFPEIFGIYCDALLQYLKEAGASNLEKFSKDRLLEDYKRHALYGYVIACFFLPALLGYFGNNMGHLANMSLQEKCQVHDTIGGDEVSKILVDMLLDLKEVGCLDHIINV